MEIGLYLLTLLTKSLKPD